MPQPDFGQALGVPTSHEKRWRKPYGRVVHAVAVLEDKKMSGACFIILRCDKSLIQWLGPERVVQYPLLGDAPITCKTCAGTQEPSE